MTLCGCRSHTLKIKLSVREKTKKIYEKNDIFKCHKIISPFKMNHKAVKSYKNVSMPSIHFPNEKQKKKIKRITLS